MIGLREFNKEYKGTSFAWRSQMFFQEIKYAWQRAWRGYDDQDIFEFSGQFLNRTVKILEEFKESNCSLFCKPDYVNGSNNNINDSFYTEKETNEIIDKIIFGLKNSDGDKIIEDKNISSMDFDGMYSCFEEASRNEKESLELFVKFFDQLWY